MMTKDSAHEMDMLRNSVAMTVTLVSFGMLFATFFLGYFLVRFNTPVWPPTELDGLPKLLPFLSTVVMGLSSLTYYLFARDGGTKKLYWVATLVLGTLFLMLQWRLWDALKASGILVSNGMVPSMLYAFTWLHAGHIVVALGAVLWLGLFIYRRPEGLTPMKLVNVGKFWHFLGVIWLLMYLMMFVL